MQKNTRRQTTLIYLLTGFLTVIIFEAVVQIHNFKIPLRYENDVLSHSMVIKGIIDNGWYAINPYLASPGRLEYYDYPMGDNNLQLFIIKFISLFSSDWGFVYNFYFLLTFILTVNISLFIFRYFSISWAPSIAGSLLFTFLPYHFLRYEHLFLSGYYLIPVCTVIIYWTLSGELAIVKPPLKKTLKNIRFNFKDKKAVFSVFFTLLMSAYNAYYAFFLIFFLAVAGLTAAVKDHELSPLFSSAILSIVITLGILINISPSIKYQITHGRNSSALIRSPAETEYYGLKITQLLLPMEGHRIEKLSNRTKAYNHNFPLVNENSTATLGIVGSLGFLLLISWIFLGKLYSFDKQAGDFLGRFSLLTLSAILTFSVGGLMSFFVVFTNIDIFRSVNRVSIFIAFFSLLAIFYALDKLLRKTENKTKAYAIFAMISLLGILDQTSDKFKAAPAVTSEFQNDERFIKQIEKNTAEQSKIYQLPFKVFPGGGKTGQMGEYDLLKGYLHSQKLQWSFGAIAGRETSQWQKSIENLPVKKMIRTICRAGFSGLYIDRYGYRDKAKSLERKLESELKNKPITSKNKRLIFFKLNSCNRQTGKS